MGINFSSLYLFVNRTATKLRDQNTDYFSTLIDSVLCHHLFMWYILQLHQKNAETMKHVAVSIDSSLRI